MTDTKPSNPKQAFGDAKVPVGLVPDTAIIEMALAMLEGALKYGGYNYRVVGVKASTYNHAMERHRKKWWNGQDRDPMTRVHELGSVMACCAILIDAEICGMLTDDRPPLAPVGPQLDDRMQIVAHLKEVFKDHSPRQFTWEDSPQIKALNESMQAGIAEALGAGPLEPEGFPNGYSIEVTGPTPEGAARRESPKVTLTVPMVTDIHTATGAQLDAREAPPHVHSAQPLMLDCGCVKRCKGHAPSSPGNYAQERVQAAVAVAARLPEPVVYGQTETHDAEFPAAPRAATFEAFSESIRGIPDIADTREFDPAD